ncbi:class I adenylate-forming enzyme family protein [Labrys wisconsinensis]|uniref:Fatty-acyl-CoA synthase n=1 Tax=Labrys wisconsinensis TaxID=425677 RepID=A0ABU0JL04_9HYPH|nr:AMP-binding protein [Labrys wisconsinensis]MDQ0474043.1 fatty-acyl-CoA synthase [Labrys wisconsinensis]
MVAAAGPTVGALFRDAARAAADKPAIIDGARTLTFGALAERVDGLAHAMRRAGARRGDRVAILSENRAEYLEVVLACAKTGLIAACQNWRQSADELAHCLGLVEPALAFVSPRYEAALAELASRCPLHVFGPSYEALLAGAGGGPAAVEAAPDDGLLILYTSGTTGLPKGAVISHRAVIARSMVMMADWGVRPGDGCIAWSPLFHMASADPSLSSLCQGAPVFITDGFDAEAIVEGLSRIDVGWFVLMPGMIERMIAALEHASKPVRRVAAAGCMANLVPPAQIAAISALLDAPFLNSFGSTETGIAPASGAMIPPGVAPASFSKRQTSFCEVRLTGDDGREVAIGEVGEMCLRSPTLFSGYWNAPAETAHDFRGGWFHMGDDFVRNADGTLDFIDRRKYLIKSGGENIYPAELERVLRASDRVAEAVVVRQPDARWGEIPVAFVVPRDPALSEADVIALLAERIARYKLPRRVIFVAEAELQRNATGKVQRQALEQRLAAEQAGAGS